MSQVQKRKSGAGLSPAPDAVFRCPEGRGTRVSGPRGACGSVGRQRLHAGRQARDLARRGVLVHDALGHAAHQFGLRGLQRQRGRIGIARGDGLFDLGHIFDINGGQFVDNTRDGTDRDPGPPGDFFNTDFGMVGFCIHTT